MGSSTYSVVKSSVTTTGIDHVVLHVGDLRRSVEFYTKVLGLPHDRRFAIARDVIAPTG